MDNLLFSVTATKKGDSSEEYEKESLVNSEEANISVKSLYDPKIEIKKENRIYLFFLGSGNKDIAEYTNGEIFGVALKHIFWVVFCSVPIVLLMSTLAFTYSRISFTNYCSSNGTCKYYKPIILLYATNVTCALVDTLKAALVASCIIRDGKLLKENIFKIMIPAFLSALIAYSLLYKYSVAIWYYYIDTGITEVLFFTTFSLSLYHISKRNGMKFLDITKRFILPILSGVLGIGFTEIYLSKKFAEASRYDRYIIRLVIYPIMVELILNFQEYGARQFMKTESFTVHGLTHFVYVAQVAFGILGRYMTTTSGSLTNVAFVSGVIAAKDVLLHRACRFQCWIGFHLRKVFKLKDVNDQATFDDWFYDKDYRNFRSCILNNDFVHELITTFTVPVLVVSFRQHRSLFNFDYDYLADESGNINMDFFIKQEAIQLIFLFLSFIAITFIEARFNRLDLRILYRERDWLQEISQFVIYIWGIYLCLSSVRLLPNYFECNSNNICHCKIDIDRQTHGCT